MPTLKLPDGLERKPKGRSVPGAVVSRRLAGSLSTASGVPRVQDLQERFRRHLHGGSEELFCECTGCRFDILWESGGPPTDGASLVGGGRGVCGGGLAVGRDGDGNGAVSVSGQHVPVNAVFARGRGGRDFSHPIEMNGILLGVAVVRLSQRERMNGKTRGTAARQDRGDAVSDVAHFQRATMLLRLVIHDAVSATLAELRAEELAQARNETASFERKSRGRRGKLQCVVLQPPRLANGCGPGSGIPAVVSLILDFVRASYRQPISLKDFARDHELNPSYLSTAFSSNVGVPFKKFLTDLRLEKARELLRDPMKKISDVAAAVGYTNQNQFMAVFKAAAGVSPSAFRKSEASK